jgi:hypothetical protein
MNGVIILEGPDGAGKSTLAKVLQAQAINRGYHVILVHNGPYQGVKNGLARLYAEAIMSGVVGNSIVIMDRSWISEAIYGPIFRQADRVGRSRARILERLMLRVPNLVVGCLPPWDDVLQNYLRRKHMEYLPDESLLRLVYDTFEQMEFDMTFNYRAELPVKMSIRILNSLNDLEVYKHGQSWPSAGKLGARFALVGAEFAAIHEGDCLYQWPFGALAGTGCSRWITERLDEAGVPERDLFWINQDAEGPVLTHTLGLVRESGGDVIALGTKAAERLQDLSIPCERIPHPQGWKRIHYFDPYPLVSYLKEKKESAQ